METRNEELRNSSSCIAGARRRDIVLLAVTTANPTDGSIVVATNYEGANSA